MDLQGAETKGRSDPKALDDALHQANAAIQKPPVKTSRFREGVENFEDRIQAPGYPATAVQFKNDNADTIAAIDVETLQQNVRGFAESSKIWMSVLDEVAKIHPFINVAVLAFKGVVTLELNRRDNDSKVITLYLKMQEMMSVLVELKDVKDPERDGTRLEARMEGLMKKTAENITACGNHCDNYLRKHVVVKLLKAPIYEAGLANFANIFAERRDEIKLALILHTAKEIDRTTHILAKIDRKIDHQMRLQQQFQALEMSEEKSLKNYIKEKGGMETFLSSDAELEELERRSHRLSWRAGPTRSKATERVTVPYSGTRTRSAYQRHPSQPYRSSYAPVSYGTNYVNEKEDDVQHGERVPDLNFIRKQLNEDLNYSLDQNMVLFQQKLNVQTGQLVEEIDNRVREINKTIKAGPHDEIIDPDVRSVWTQHAWKRSVKSRHFILALHDHFLDKYPNDSSPTHLGEDFTIDRVLSRANQAADDRWALKCLNIRTLQPVLEAFDDDSTGFITIKEVNTLTASKPADWSLPQWLAYWAVGWHQTLWEYKEKIKDVLTQMYSSFNVLGPNRTLVDLYLDHPVFGEIDRLLLGLDPPGDNVNQIMRHKIESYRKTEEARLENTLESLSFDIDDPDTMTLVIGTGRVERYLFPLLYLILKRHLSIIRLGSRYILHHNELKSAVQSIVQVFNAVTDRINALSAIVVHRSPGDISQYFKKVAFAMFKYLSGLVILLGETRDLEPSYPNEGNALEGLRPEILKYPIQEKMDRAAYDLLGVALCGSGHNLSGEWSGYCYHHNLEDTHGLMQVLITNANMPDRKFYGRGHDIHGTFEIRGEIRDDEKLGMNFVRSEISDGETCPLLCEAILNVHRGTIVGTWGIRGVSQIGSLHLNRTPTSLYRFRHIDRPYDGNIARDRWTYAIQAVIHDLHIRLRLWSWSFFKARFAERKRYCQLWYCQNLTDHPRASSIRETAELKTLERILHPADSQFYRSIARTQFKSAVHINAVCISCDRVIIGDRIIRIDNFDERDDVSNVCAQCLPKISWPCILKLAHTVPTRFTGRTVGTYAHMSTSRGLRIRGSTDLDVSQPSERQRLIDETVSLEPASLSLGFIYKQRSGKLKLEAHAWRRESPSNPPPGYDYETISESRTSSPLTVKTHISGHQALCGCCGEDNGPYWACMMCAKEDPRRRGLVNLYDVLICDRCDVEGKHNRFHPLVRWLIEPAKEPHSDTAGWSNSSGWRSRLRMPWGRDFIVKGYRSDSSETSSNTVARAWT